MFSGENYVCIVMAMNWKLQWEEASSPQENKKREGQNHIICAHTKITWLFWLLILDTVLVESPTLKLVMWWVWQSAQDAMVLVWRQKGGNNSIGCTAAAEGKSNKQNPPNLHCCRVYFWWGRRYKGAEAAPPVRSIWCRFDDIRRHNYKQICNYSNYRRESTINKDCDCCSISRRDWYDYTTENENQLVVPATNTTTATNATNATNTTNTHSLPANTATATAFSTTRSSSLRRREINGRPAFRAKSEQ